MKKTMQSALLVLAVLAIAPRPGAGQEQHAQHDAAPQMPAPDDLAQDLLKDVLSRPALGLADFNRMAVAWEWFIILFKASRKTQ